MLRCFQRIYTGDRYRDGKKRRGDVSRASALFVRRKYLPPLEGLWARVCRVRARAECCGLCGQLLFYIQSLQELAGMRGVSGQFEPVAINRVLERFLSPALRPDVVSCRAWRNFPLVKLDPWK